MQVHHLGTEHTLNMSLFICDNSNKYIKVTYHPRLKDEFLLCEASALFQQVIVEDDVRLIAAVRSFRKGKDGATNAKTTKTRNMEHAPL